MRKKNTPSEVIMLWKRSQMPLLLFQHYDSVAQETYAEQSKQHQGSEKTS